MGTRRARVWALLHAPLTTLLLIYFEGLSSALGFADASPLISSLFDELLIYRTALVDGTAVPQAITDQLTNQLGLLGISLSDYTSTLRALPAAARETQLNRYFAQVVYSLFQQLGTPPTIEGADLYKRIMTQDSAATLENALDFVSNSSEGVLEPILAVFPAAGGVLLVSVILRWIQRTPADVFECP